MPVLLRGGFLVFLDTDFERDFLAVFATVFIRFFGVAVLLEEEEAFDCVYRFEPETLELDLLLLTTAFFFGVFVREDLDERELSPVDDDDDDDDDEELLTEDDLLFLFERERELLLRLDDLDFLVFLVVDFDFLFEAETVFLTDAFLATPFDSLSTTFTCSTTYFFSAPCL